LEAIQALLSHQTDAKSTTTAEMIEPNQCERMRRFFQENDVYAREMATAKEAWVATQAGKSGSFLAFSPTKRYMMKSLPPREVVVLLKHLSAYVEHMCDADHGSLLARFMALYAVKHEDRDATTYVLLMVNACYASPPTAIYDLKGSWLGRQAHSVEERVRKDQDWCRTEKERRALQKLATRLSPRGTSAVNARTYATRFLQFMTRMVVTPERMDAGAVSTLRAMLERDVQFLRDTMHVMDYSLLVCEVPSSSSEDVDWTGQNTLLCVPSAPSHMPSSQQAEPVDLYLGVIDFLSPYDRRKQLQHHLHSMADVMMHPIRWATRKRRSRSSSRLKN